jgi:solute carrier family 25 carnitine/acylcarnitine transporter 20/29
MTSKQQRQLQQPSLQDKSYQRDKEQSQQQQQEIKKVELSSIGSSKTSDDTNTNTTTDVNLKPMHDLIAGGVAGSVSVIVGHPFDTIKVNMQAQANNNNNPTLLNNSNHYYSLSNIQSLYRGVAAPLSTAAVFNAVVFASFGSFTRLWEHTFEQKKKDTDQHILNMDIHNQQRLGGTEGFESLRGEALHAERRRQQQQQQDQPSNRQDVSSLDTDKQRQQKQSQHTIKIFLCGMAAGMVQTIFLCPMEHIKCRVQVDTTHKYRGTAHACYSIIQEHGIKALNRGMGATLCREVPSFGMYFVSYDIVKVYIEKMLQQMNTNNSSNNAAANNNEHAHAYIASALAGGISGVLAWLVTYPFDVIKTQIQTSPLEHVSKGTWVVGRELVQTHGWKYMFRGLGVCLFTAVPVNAVIFPTYEYVLELLEGDD